MQSIKLRSESGPTLNLELKLHDAIPVWKSSPEDRMSFYVRAARYHRLLCFVAERVLSNPDRATIAVENCLYSAAQHVTAFDHEGAFRSWLVRLAIEEALTTLHGSKFPGLSRFALLSERTIAQEGCLAI